MKIDWDSKAGQEGVGESASILRRSRRRSGSERNLESALESVTTEAASGGGGLGEHERLERLREALDAAQPAMPEGEREALKEKVLAGARAGLAKVNQGEPTQNFTLGEHVGLEAVILTNGERPSLVVRDGFIDLGAPDIGDWDHDLGRVQDKIRKVTASVGRIDVPERPWFAGTCFVVAEGLVITNRHVLEAIAVQDAAGGWTFKWPGETTVDFIAEDGATSKTKFKVTGVAFAGPDPINNTVNFAHLDMAILRVDPASDPPSRFPMPVTFETDVLKPAARRDLYVVGFPGQPRTWRFDGTPWAGHETTQVMSALFNDKFGLKRLAPGSVKTAAGAVAGDEKKWICAHDASTLAGNSGSCIVDLTGDGYRIVALHFAGVNRQQNWAHVVGHLRDQLSNFSATFV